MGGGGGSSSSSWSSELAEEAVSLVSSAASQGQSALKQQQALKGRLESFEGQMSQEMSGLKNDLDAVLSTLTRRRSGGREEGKSGKAH
jgi:hypothetical protein